MIAPGDVAPDFELPDQDGAPVVLSGLRGRTVVLYFYPRADEVCAMTGRMIEAALTVPAG